MTKTDELLRQLEDSIPEYIKSIGSFQCRNDAWTLTGHYTTKRLLSCQICGHTPIIDVYVIKSTRGQKLNVGNVCINNIVKQKIGRWFKQHLAKKVFIKKYRPMIDVVDMIITHYENGTLPIPISELGIERLRKMLQRMSGGVKPLDKTVKLALYYVEKLGSTRA